MKDDGLILGVLIFVFAIGVVTGGLFARNWTKDGERMDAIKAGAAEYITNKETGTAEFRWVTPK